YVRPTHFSPPPPTIGLGTAQFSMAPRRLHMRIRLLFLALVSLMVIGLGATGSVAASRQVNVAFEFRGELAAAPPPGSSSLLVDAARGHKRALRPMLGHPSAQS